MRNLLLTIAIVFAMSSFAVAKNNEHASTYDGLAPLQAVDSESSCPYRYEAEDRLEGRTGRTDRDSSRSTRRSGSSKGEDQSYRFGWAGPIPYNGLADTAEPSTSHRSTKIISSESFTAQRPRRVGKTGSGHKIDKTEKDELPFIDKAGDTNRNYCIMLTATWCSWCQKMYKEIETLRKDGYRVYVLDIDDYPDLKDKLNRLDPKAPKIGSGAPWIIIRDGGKTTQVFRGFTKAEKIAPHLKHYKTQLKEEQEQDKEAEETDTYDLK